jgi:ribosomal-protein-alanine N-acetyltransferase
MQLAPMPGMAKSKVIKSEKLRIVPFSEVYLTERYVSWLNNPEVVRFSDQRFRTHTLESCRAYINSFEGSPNYFWAIVSRISSEGHIGNINAYVDTRNIVADVGILIGEKKLWGKGYGLEALSAVVNFLFREAGMRKVTVGTLALNMGMRNIMHRLGMKEEGRRIRQVMFEEKEVDIIYGALFRDEWTNFSGKNLS